MAFSRTLDVFMTDAEYDRALGLATQAGVTMSDLIRRALDAPVKAAHAPEVPRDPRRRHIRVRVTPEHARKAQTVAQVAGMSTSDLVNSTLRLANV